MQTTIAGIEFKGCVWNASGVWGTTIQEMTELLRLSPAVCGALVMKSCTKNPRSGNVFPRVFVDAANSLISVGLANNGWDYYFEAATQLDDQRPIFISEGGMASLGDELAEFIEKANRLDRQNVLFEFNFSCPNIRGHPQAGYDFHQFQERIEFIRRRIQKPWGVKLPPYHDVAQMQIIAERFLIPAIEDHLAFVTCCNSMGGGLVIDRVLGETRIAPNSGVGGIGGAPLKPVALGNVWTFYNLLPRSVKIIGCGGVTSGRDVMDFLLAGASAVEVGTAIYEDVRVLEEIVKTVVSELNGSDVQTVCGKLRITTPTAI